MQEHIEQAREQMIAAGEPHLDSLVAGLHDPGVRKTIEVLFSDGFSIDHFDSDAFQMCVDLGLIRFERGVPSITNPIYREVLVRQEISSLGGRP